jgi:hypothetical protein
MIKRSVSIAVGRFGKANVLENVGKIQVRQIVGDSAELVDCPVLACAVQRRRFPSGCKPHPATAPAGSNRSNRGGNEAVEAFGEACHEIR